MFGFKSGLYKFVGEFTKQNYCKEFEYENYDSILDYIKTNVDYNTASLLIFGKNNKKLKTVAQHGDGCNLIGSMNFKMGSGLSAWLAQKKRSICLSDIHRGARHGHNPIRSFVSVPIFLHDNVIGVLNLAHITPNAYGPKEVRALENITESIAPQLNELRNSLNKETQSERYYSSH